jgi:adenosylmethionine-8-amino-7-oxononanoate aminotransferase
MPPYCIDDEALMHLATTTRIAIDRAIEDSRACA